MNKLCPMPGCSVERITRDGPGFLHVAAHGTRPGNRCPDCRRASRAVHSRYRRRPTDLPSLGRALRIDLRVRRFYCRNAACARRTFAERLPELLRPHARRTRRLAEAQGRVGVALGGEAGARLLQHLSMPASADTVLRLVRGLPLPEQEPPRVRLYPSATEWLAERDDGSGVQAVRVRGAHQERVHAWQAALSLPGLGLN